jgi:hypothetical protein
MIEDHPHYRRSSALSKIIRIIDDHPPEHNYSSSAQPTFIYIYHLPSHHFYTSIQGGRFSVENVGNNGKIAAIQSTNKVSMYECMNISIWSRVE